ncbi:hypothetical protein NEOLEDRAFT_1148136 [Neolentinus lepideus HHB14362 ss-1]|uniref:Uncharacterized protein n=1 Tax=Neolentinus lepideus HHB14362 ss-1 TaxID=1314782 RepID=A0A165SI85_9AGAM|nr:hypothetical protein NEOLEDRAFT_1148136 [Neolentinus lepideus HHB14362 ss-1]
MAPSMTFAVVYQPGNNALVLSDDHSVATQTKKMDLFKVSACVICHSDVFLLCGAFPLPNSLYLAMRLWAFSQTVLYSLMPEVTDIGKGMLYAVWVVDTCVARAVGNVNTESTNQNGEFSKYVPVDESQLLPVRNVLKLEVAALAVDSMIIAYNAIHKASGVAVPT